MAHAIVTFGALMGLVVCAVLLFVETLYEHRL
jgi:hypothetical protein